MFIVWRKKPIITDRKTELFVEYSNVPVHELAGRVLKSGRIKEDSSLRPAWTPLWCDHKGEGRLAWTPLLMHAERVSGKPRQKLLHRLPTIRSCCIHAPFLRAAWWYAVEEKLRFFEEEDTGLAGRLIARDKKVILAKLREIVPPVSRRAAHDFESYRLHRETERNHLAEEWDDPLHNQVEEEERREAEPREQQRAKEAKQRARAEAERRAQEAQEREVAERRAREAARRRAEELAQQEREAERAWNEFVQERQRAGFGGFNGVIDCWAILGLLHSASLEQIRKNYRDLLMKHHPDRGGDVEVCKRINAAYEQAQSFWGVGR